MATRKRSYGQLSARAKARADRAGEVYGLTHEQVRRRYNRGTFNPFARANPELRVPREYRQFTDNGETDWREAALANVRAKLGDYFKYNDDSVVYEVYTQASEDALRVMAMASEDELIAYARIQDANGLPPSLPKGLADSMGYYTNGKWNNIFWYH